MKIKTIFSGSKKILTIPLVLLVGFIFLPVTIFLLLTWLSYTKIGNKKLKYSAASVFALFTLFFGTAYASALISPSPKVNKEVPVVQNVPLAISAATPVPEVLSVTTTASQSGLVKATRVIDGDTIEIEGGQKVRYIGMDTPELSGSVGCFAQEAYSQNRQLVEGKEVRLEKDVSDKDRYGRLLRYVYVEDQFINDILVRTGHALEKAYPPDIKYQNQFKDAEREARENNVGLWNSCKTLATASPKPTIKPISTPKPTAKPTVKPIVISTPAPLATVSPQQNGGGGYSCNCSKTCTTISSCQEAQYLLNVCGCSQRDADHDGIACDSAPLHCQN